jgi:hypothetical protein
VLQVLCRESGLTLKSPPEWVAGGQTWHVNDAGFSFCLHGFETVLGPRFAQTHIQEQNPLSGAMRESFRVYRNKANPDVELLFDYELYESVHRVSIEGRATQAEAIREFDAAQDDRERLKEEMARYEQEVRESLDRFAQTAKNGAPVRIEDTEEIGVHMFTTVDRGTQYKQRMYTYRVPRLDRTFRVAKLVLAHPTLENRACVFRFIFGCRGSLRTFYGYTPLFDQVVRSFRWSAERTGLDRGDIARAQDRFKRR